MSLQSYSEKILYLWSISFTAHASAPAAFFASETTGTSRCGMPLYFENSTIFGSISKSFTSSGVALKRILIRIEFTHTDLPEPVVPAISR